MSRPRPARLATSLALTCLLTATTPGCLVTRSLWKRPWPQDDRPVARGLVTTAKVAATPFTAVIDAALWPAEFVVVGFLSWISHFDYWDWSPEPASE